MKTPFLTLLLSLSLSMAYAQTRLIAHRSHSGNNASFTHSLNTSAAEKDFGVAPTRRVRTAVLDSLIYVSDTMVIMVTSNYCKEVSRFRYPQSYEDNMSMDERMNGADLWNAGRDTLCGHPLFSQNHQKDSIKKVLDKEYHFNNPAKDVVFIGYDNKEKKEDKQEVLPVVIPEQQQPPVDMRPLIGIGILMLCSILIGIVSWKLYQFNVVQKV